MSDRKIEILDTTLRDGAQMEGISFSVNDKFQVFDSLSALGIKYVEAGNPGSNPKDREFFARYKNEQRQPAGGVLAAFGSTRRKGMKPQDDPGLADLMSADTSTIVVFGKCWNLQVREVLRVSLKENLSMIEDTISWLVSNGREVIFDAEHFFEAWRENRDYALDCMRAAARGGAVCICLCDTNGSTMPEEVSRVTGEVLSELEGVKIGIHCHNDTGMAVANSIAAVLAGADHVQGTLNGIGERCGNANLATIIANLELKYGISCLPEGKLEHLTPAVRNMAEIANIVIPNGEPYVGISAFTHKAGMHVDGVKKNPSTFEHVPPESVGNSRRFLMSEIAGRAAVLDVIHRIRPDMAKDAPEVARVLHKMKELEHQGYHFEGAEASQELLVCKELGMYKPFFNLEKIRIASEQPQTGEYSAYAFIKILVDGIDETTAAEGEGPVNAMDRALKKAMKVFYPQLTSVRLTDYKVRVLNADDTASSVRTLIESTDGYRVWRTVGVSTDILEASWQALVDSLEYKLMRSKLGWED